MPKVSVVIPSYNCREYINQAVSSVLSQTCDDYEVIIVDDCSTDGTREILREIKNPKIKVVLLEKNQGPSVARNQGISLSHGKYIAFLDSDDAWLTDKLKKQLSLFEGDEDIGLVYSDCLLVDKLGDITNGRKKRLFDYFAPQKGRVFEKLLVSNFIPTSSVIFKREIAEDIGFFDGQYLVGQDFDYFLRISRKYIIDYIDEPLVKYRWNVGLTRSMRSTALKDGIEIIKKYLYQSSLSLFRRTSVNYTLMHYYKELGFFYLKNKKYPDARKSFWEAVARCPLNPKAFYGLAISLCSLRGDK